MRILANVKEVQQLTGRMVALSRFLSVGGDKGYPYCKCLKKNNHFICTPECEEAFIRLKEYPASPLILYKSPPGIPLRLYFTVIDRAISLVIVQKQDRVQKPIYFVSKVLQGPEARYQAIEKAVLALVFAAR